MGESGSPVGATQPEQELEAMKAVAAALTGIDRVSAQRVLRWAAEIFKLTPLATEQPRSAGPPIGAAPPPGESEVPPDDLASLFASAAPESGPEKALVAGYFQQVTKGAPEFDAQALNAELKHLGHQLSNVTVTLSALINQAPSLVIQTKKLGKGQQARKRYRLTYAGIQRVRQMLGRATATSGAEG
jgi:hypothetical protein